GGGRALGGSVDRVAAEQLANPSVRASWGGPRAGGAEPDRFPGGDAGNRVGWGANPNIAVDVRRHVGVCTPTHGIRTAAIAFGVKLRRPVSALTTNVFRAGWNSPP